MNFDFANPRPSACKICGSPRLALAGTTDFNRVDMMPPPFPPAGIPVQFWQCGECGFAWAPGFDEWTEDLFRDRIYNADIARIESLDNAAQRSANVMAMLGARLPIGPGGRILDYGCGPGALVEELRAAGFDACGYDRYYAGADKRPDGQFDVVTCFEVMEHLHRPHETVDDLLSFLKPDGVAILGTMLAERPLHVDWWYCSPRSGHIAFWTFPALCRLFHPRKLNVASDGKMFHFVFADVAKPKMQAAFGG